jgi:hypothetical protein
MRTWNLGPGDPLALTLVADFRLCTPDYVNDHIWELEIGAGDPPALSLCTTYGLRARRMRLFPQFTLGNQSISDPAAFSIPPRLRRFFPNYLALNFSPFQNIEVEAEYWAPDSHTTSGRFAVTNTNAGAARILLELCGQLSPLDGQSLAPIPVQSVNILSGQSGNLAPVIFLTGGPQPGPGPYPSLALELILAAGETRTLTWAQAALGTPRESLELARRTAARPWESELAKIERVNAAQTIDVHTGDADWDAAFALSQKIGFGLFFGPNQHLPNPSFVLTRQPDQGYSPLGDGRDYPHLWSGQPILESGSLASLLPGAPQLAAGLVRNFLVGQSVTGEVDWKPGLTGQRGRWLSAPLLANLAWHTYQLTRDVDFLREVQPGLEAFFHRWFDSSHDRDGDGFPEWEHPMQTGLEDNPAFTVWQTDGRGADISASESPALAAMLCREAQSLAHISEVLEQPEGQTKWEKESIRLQLLTEECWTAEGTIYHLRDRDTHRSPSGRPLGSRRGSGVLTPRQSFKQPVRLLIRLELDGAATNRPEITLQGQNGDAKQEEHLERKAFQWGAGLAVATTHLVYTSITKIEVSGIGNRDRMSVSVMDFSSEDLTFFLPLWAGIPNQLRAQDIANHSLFAADRFGRFYGIPVCGVTPVSARGKTASVFPDEEVSQHQLTTSICQGVHLAWNTLIGEGLLNYGLREEAAVLTGRLMAVVVNNLKQEHAFAYSYHAVTGTGMGERNPVQGLAPLGFFLSTIGVRIEMPCGSQGSGNGVRVELRGKNPFPWPVTVKYRGLNITRGADQSVIIFPDGQTVTLTDPTDAVISEAPVGIKGLAVSRSSPGTE